MLQSGSETFCLPGIVSINGLEICGVGHVNGSPLGREFGTPAAEP